VVHVIRTWRRMCSLEFIFCGARNSYVEANACFAARSIFLHKGGGECISRQRIKSVSLNVVHIG